MFASGVHRDTLFALCFMKELYEFGHTLSLFVAAYCGSYASTTGSFIGSGAGSALNY